MEDRLMISNIKQGQNNFLTRLMLKIVRGLAFIFLLILFVMSVRHSITFDEAGEEGCAIFIPQKFGFIIFRMAVIFLALMVLKRVKPVISKKMFYVISLIYFLLNICFVFVISLHPTSDQYYMTWIASDMLKGEYSQFKPFGYMDLYPFQYSFISYVKLVFAFLGPDNYYALQILNVIYLLLIIWFIVRITGFLYGKEQYGIGIALMLFFPLSFYVTYIYGTFLSLALSLASAFFLLKLLKGKGRLWLNFLLVVILNTLSILAKNNALIFTMAEICIIILYAVKQANKKAILGSILLTAAILVTYGLAQTAVNRDLARYTEADKVGTPKLSWIAMGLQTGGVAEGWYNCYNRDVYWENDCDTERAAEVSRASIKESIGKFLDDPKYCVRFYYKKICSEWMNPSFEAFNLIQYSTDDNPNRTIKYSIPARWFLHRSQGKSLDATHFILNEYLKIYELAIIIGAIFYLINRRFDMADCLFAVVFIGGFIFHIFWEAACQYMLPYFIMLIPYGVIGLKDASDIAADKMRMYGVKDKA